MKRKVIILGAGCFWGVQARLDVVEGVVETEVGYAGGSVDSPTYEGVCSGDTGHAEVVRVVYDRDVISTESLLNVFFDLHDPTQIDRQGVDVGSQYRSVIFYFDDEQLNIARKIIMRVRDDEGIQYSTQILSAADFFAAEDYHQKYNEKRKTLFA
jgi:methionine-S-sulfoxide reductase